MSFDLLSTAAGLVLSGEVVSFPYPSGRTRDDYVSTGAYVTAGGVGYSQEQDIFWVSYDSDAVRVRWGAGGVAAGAWVLKAPLTVAAGIKHGLAVSAPSAPIIAAIGTSSVYRSYVKLTGLNTSDVSWSEVGWVTWLARICPQIAIRHSHTFGFAGETSDVMLANISSITSASPKPAACLIQLSSNDANDTSGTIAAFIARWSANYVAMARACLAVGIKPIFVIQHIRNDTAGTSLNRLLALMSWMRSSARAEVPGSYLVDTVPVTAALTSATPSTTTGLMDDTVHLDVGGAYLSATAIKPVIDALFPSTTSWPVVVPGDIWSAENPFGSLTVNPGMLGTGGTEAGGATGDTADGYTLTGGNGLTVVGSKVTSADGFVRQRVTVSGSASSEGFITLDASMVSGALAALLPDEKVEMGVYYTVSSLTNFRQVACRWSPIDAGYGVGVNKHHRDGAEFTSTKLNNNAHSGLLRPPIHTVVGAVTAPATPARFFLDVINGVTNASVIDIGPFAVRRVPG